MPWCAPCERFYNPNSVTEEGDCPSCGAPLERGEHGKVAAAEPLKVPWHFWVLLACACLYLAWRLIQGVSWLFS